MHLNEEPNALVSNGGGNSHMNLDDMVKKTCFCKLRERCEDKDSHHCMRNRNIYQEFMLSRKQSF
jgi:ribosomal protein S14